MNTLWVSETFIFMACFWGFDIYPGTPMNNTENQFSSNKSETLHKSFPITPKMVSETNLHVFRHITLLSILKSHILIISYIVFYSNI